MKRVEGFNHGNESVVVSSSRFRATALEEERRVSGASTSGATPGSVPTCGAHTIYRSWKRFVERGTRNTRLDAFTKAVREPDAFNLASRTPPLFGEREGDNWRNNDNYSATARERSEERV